jgi:hypothetical protein
MGVFLDLTNLIVLGFGNVFYCEMQSKVIGKLENF